jgi:autotransporter-associated beta strand protein
VEDDAMPRSTGPSTSRRVAAPVALEPLERRALLSRVVAPLFEPEPLGIAAREFADAAWQTVPAANFGQISPAHFTNDELRYVQPLYHFHTVANSVVETATATLPRGWINLKVWREPVDNQPYNARVLENQVAFAFFYSTDRPWNPYYGNQQVRNRLEAIMDLWSSMQNRSGGQLDGSWSEYSATNWSLAPTGFGLRAAVATLEALEGGPAIDAGVKQRFFDATLRGIRALLATDYWLNAGQNFSNQYTSIWGTALMFADVYPQYANEIGSYLDARMPQSDARHQSPAGFMYEAAGPDFSYTLGTHQNNITSGWHELRGTRWEDDIASSEGKLYDWFGYNLVRQPTGGGYFANVGATTRLTGRYFTTNTNPASEVIPQARFLNRTAAEEAAALNSQRNSLIASWGNWGTLANPSSNSYTPVPFTERDRVGWRPTEQQRLDSIRSLPYYASTQFNHQLTDNRRAQQITLVRRPDYYSAINTGQLVTSIQRLGLGLFWNETYGTAMQTSPNTNNATYGTRNTSSGDFYEANTITPSFSLNGTSFSAQAGTRRLADGTLSVRYNLGSAGNKTFTYANDALTVAINHTGAFTETLPLLRRSNEAFTVTSNRISLTRGAVTFSIEFPAGTTVNRSTPGVNPGDSQLIENVVLVGSGSLTYTMKFTRTLPTSVSGDRTALNVADTFRLVRNGPVTQLFLNDALLPETQWDAAAGPGNLALNGLGGDDQLVIDLSGGNPLPTSGLSFNGGAGAANTVVVNGGSGADTVVLRAAQVQVGAGTIAYSSTQSLQLNLGAGGDVLDVAGNADVSTSAVNVNVAAGGTLSMLAGRSLPDFTDLTVDGTFNLAGTAQVIDTLAGGGVVLNNGASTTLTLGNANGDATFSGAINNGTGTLGLVKVGAGTQTLAGTGTYSGATEIRTGALRVTSAAALGSASGGTVVRGGTFTGRLELDGGITLAEPITLEARGDPSLASATQLLNVAGSNTLSANLRTLWGGLGYAIESAAGTLTLAGDVFYGDTQTYDRPLHLRGAGAGVISGSVRGNSGFDHNLVKSGTGTWTLTTGQVPSGSATSVTATTAVQAGTLALGGRLPNGAVSVSGGTLALIASPAIGQHLVPTLAITNDGRLDLRDHDLLVGTATLAAIQPLLLSGFAGGAWTGGGIVSSLADDRLFGIGYETVGAGVRLVHARWGDANLDGSTNDADLQTLRSNYGQSSRTWAAGSFDYDAAGLVGIGDLVRLSGGYTPAPTAFAEPAAVPTPRATPLDTPVRFALPGAPSGVGLSSFSLTRNGVAVPLTGATLAVPQPRVLELGNLAPLTTQPGVYVLRLGNVGWTVAGGQALLAPVEVPFFVYKTGDMNNDGTVNNQDIALFVQGLTDAAAFEASLGYSPAPAGDVNGDGTFNNQDISPFVALLTGSRPAPQPPTPTVQTTSRARPAMPFADTKVGDGDMLDAGPTSAASRAGDTVATVAVTPRKGTAVRFA